MTFLNAFSKSFGSSEAPTSFAMATKRLWRSASVSFRCCSPLRVIGLPLIQNPYLFHNSACASEQQEIASVAKPASRPKLRDVGQQLVPKRDQHFIGL